MNTTKTIQRLMVISLALSAGIAGNATLASAQDVEPLSLSRSEMIMKKLMPGSARAERADAENLSKRLVMSSDGVGQQNVVINNQHSLDLSVLFMPQSAQLSDKARALLNDLGEALQDSNLRKATYLIGGHTDANGDAEQNRKLSQQRASRVKTYLVDNFDIDPDRLATAGFGEQRLADKDNPKAQINRRIEVSLISTGYQGTKKRRATTSAKYAPSFTRTTPRSIYHPYRAAPVVYQGYREFDDYNSSITIPSSTTGDHVYGFTYNVVCDSYRGVLTDPRPQHMELDDYDARTPTTCPAASEFQGAYTSGRLDRPFGNYSPEDDNELLK